MPSRIVRGQKVDAEKVLLAKQFRRRMTREETVLWEALRRGALEGLHFRRQQVIAGFIVDFYCHRAGLAVEVDGPSHQRHAEYDKERDDELSGLGVRIIRVTNEAVSGALEKVLATIAAAAEQRT